MEVNKGMGAKHAVLFGGTGGIGRNLLSLLLHYGYRVTLAVRNTSHAYAITKQYSYKGSSFVDFIEVDLVDEQSIREFLIRFQPRELDLVIFASGVRGPSPLKDFNYDFEVNYVAPVSIGIDLLGRFPKLQVVNVTSSAAFRFRLNSPEFLFVKSNSNFGGNYAKSKLALVLASVCLSKMFPHSRIISVDPGSNKTKMTLSTEVPYILRFASTFFFSDPNVGASRIMNVILNTQIPSGTHINGNGKLRDLISYNNIINYVSKEISNGFPYMPQ